MLREAEGWTLSAAARGCNITKSYLWTLENGGSPGLSLEVATRLMDFYGGSLAMLSRLPLAAPPHEATRENVK